VLLPLQDEPLEGNVTREQDVLKRGLEECYNMHCFSERTANNSIMSLRFGTNISTSSSA